MTRTLVLWGAIFFCSFSTEAFGGWIQEQNHFYTEISYGYYFGDKVFNRLGRKVPNRISPTPSTPSLTRELSTYTQHSSSFYVAYGLGWDFELTFGLNFYTRARQDSPVLGNFVASGLGDGFVGLKYLWFERPWLVLMAGTDFTIPSGDKNAVGQVPGQQDQPIALGSGTVDVTLYLSGSHSFYPIPMSVSANIGYRMKGIDTSSVLFDAGIPWGVNGGYTFNLDNPWITSIGPSLSVRGRVTKGKVTLAEEIGSNTNVSGGQGGQNEFMSVGTSLNFGFPKSISAYTGFSYPFWGKNSGAGWGINSGVGWSY